MNTISFHRTTADDPQLVDLVEEITQKLQSGEPCVLDEYVARYPQYADRVHNWFVAMTAMAGLGPSLTAGPLLALGESRGENAFQSEIRDPQSEIAPSTCHTLGDFRILRELGRGGMGVVYEAEQVSIGRRVALKVLPFAAVLDRQQLNRFKNEARAAGTLDHPNIVAIHSVGCERGVHYYAMQLIEGQSLAEIIAAMKPGRPPSRLQFADQRAGPSSAPTCSEAAAESFALADDTAKAALPTLRSTGSAAFSNIPPFDSREYFSAIAKLGIQAAEALDHAHQNGILHRDIKPANLLLDDAGKLWITDFGLARIEQDAGMTMTGDILGTLRYMSPEQALAKRAVVDHRSDIYSLGVTLYELVTLQPAFTGDDRQELLRQIAFDEPRKPRQINSHIPQDLETIVLKAIEKNPADRYATAQALADDLQRFLQDEPIQARRPGLAHRWVQYSRRHHRFLMMLVVGLVLGLIGLGVSTTVVTTALGRARHAEQQVVRERDLFRGQRDLAEANLYVADMRLAHEEWKQSHLTAVDSLLNAHFPRDGEKDLRGWEWYYVQSLGRRDVATLRGHSAGVSAVAWSPDGQRLATASRDYTLKVWDAVNIRELATLRGHKDLVSSVAWSPDGKKLASASWDKTVRVWDVASGTAMEIAASDDLLRCVAWSPDGKRLASCGDDGLVNVWDAANGNELLRMEGHRDLVWQVAWSPDGRRLASVGNYLYRDIRIWDADTGKQIHEQPAAHDHAILSVAWSPDGKRLATSSMDQRVKVWDTESWSYRTLMGHTGIVCSVSWSPDGSLLASAGSDGAVILWDPNNGEPVRTLRGHRGGVSSVHWRSDGKRLASASGDATAKIWDPNQDQEFTQITTVGAMDWSPDGAQLASVVREPGEAGLFGIQIFDSSIGLPLGSPIRLSAPRSAGDEETIWTNAGQVAWSPSGQQIACGLTSENSPRAAIIKVLNVSTNTEALSLPIPPSEIGAPEIRSIKWSPDSHHLAAGMNCDHNNVAIIWDLSTGESIAQLSHKAPLESVAWSPDGKRLATASWDNIIKTWDTTTWREMMQFNRHPGLSGVMAGGPHIVAWSPDGSELAAGSRRGWVIVWDPVTGRETLSFSAHTALIRSIAFSPDGHRLATASQDHSVKLWDVNGGKHLLTLRGHDSQVNDVAWSPDGMRLLSSGGQKHLIWDASMTMNNRPDK